MPTFKLGELFCGPGGLAFGAIHSKSEDEAFSVEHAWSSDYDKDSCSTYTQNICPSAPESVICCDVRNLDINALSEIDAFAYGFPLQQLFKRLGTQDGGSSHRLKYPCHDR
ncbi:MAG: DNA cytosine methyltransferase [Muribaculaceae bacterium]|nr:DNA cytosine methyltransferase [Muribaculaceae bacterium]